MQTMKQQGVMNTRAGCALSVRRGNAKADEKTVSTSAGDASAVGQSTAPVKKYFAVADNDENMF